MTTAAQFNSVNQFAGRADWLAAAIHAERHPGVRRILALNAWKMHSWVEYACWKKHARRCIFDFRGLNPMKNW
jgi:hypothetical protein